MQERVAHRFWSVTIDLLELVSVAQLRELIFDVREQNYEHQRQPFLLVRQPVLNFSVR